MKIIVSHTEAQTLLQYEPSRVCLLVFLEERGEGGGGGGGGWGGGGAGWPWCTPLNLSMNAMYVV